MEVGCLGREMVNVFFLKHIALEVSKISKIIGKDLSRAF